MANGNLSKAEKRRRAQQSARDRSSRTSQNNNRTNSLSTTQTHTIMTMASIMPKTGSDEKPVTSWSIGPDYIPALKLAVTSCVSWRIRSLQAYIIPTMADTTPALIGILAVPEKWNVKSLADVQACGGTIAKSTASKISSNTIGAETNWKPKTERSSYEVYYGCSRNPATPIEIGAMEFRIVIETRGISLPA